MKENEADQEKADRPIKFILDEPKVLKTEREAEKTTDFLKTEVYAKVLVKAIQGAPTGKVFTIGLFGRWGTGKTSIVDTAKDSLKEDKKVKFITYDAWRYVNNSFRRTFLFELYKQLNKDKGESAIRDKFYNDKSTQKGGSASASVGAGTKLLRASIGGSYNRASTEVTPHEFAEEQFEYNFKDIVSEKLNGKDENREGKFDKLVIVIDNIDRCTNGTAYTLLSNIKTFFCSESLNLVFVIPVDDEALRKHILRSDPDETDANQEKEEFLRKFFNVTLRIKSYGETDLYAFAKHLSDTNCLGFQKNTLRLASQEYAKNPRRLIQLFNNLSLEKAFYEKTFSQTNETLICCLLIVREEYPDYYKALLAKPAIFKDKNYLEDDKDTKEWKNKEELKRFVHLSQALLGEVTLADLAQVLTNTGRLFSEDIKAAVDGPNIPAISNILKSRSSALEEMLDYIVYRLEQAKRNELLPETVPLMQDDNFWKIIFGMDDLKSFCRDAYSREVMKEQIIEECKRLSDGNRDKLYSAVLEVFIAERFDKDKDKDKDIEVTLELMDSMAGIPSFDKNGLMLGLLNGYLYEHYDRHKKTVPSDIKDKVKAVRDKKSKEFEPEMIYVKGGDFLMGSDNKEDNNTSSVHKVTLSSFQIGKYEVTRRQWKAVMDDNSSASMKDDDYPVESVSWKDVQEGFIRKLNEKTGKNYRLPTEAEWEYAARGGQQSHGYKYSGSNDLNDVGWFSDNSGGSAHPVGQKQANELGLYDMSGNVWEWCSDWYGEYPATPQENPPGSLRGSSRVVRGGSWRSAARFCRVSTRAFNAPGIRIADVGFRLVSPL